MSNDTLDTVVEFVRGLIVEAVDDSMPLERGLAAHRSVQAKKVKKMADTATDVRDLAYQMANDLAAEKVVLNEVTEAAKKRRKSFVTQEEAKKDKEYIRLTQEIAESRENVAELEAMVAESFADSDEAINMINTESDNLARVARQDAQFVRKEKMTSLREQQLASKEAILKIFPQDQSNYRARQSKKLDKRITRLKSRNDVVDAMWQHQNPAGEQQEVGSGAEGVMDEIEKSL